MTKRATAPVPKRIVLHITSGPRCRCRYCAMCAAAIYVTPAHQYPTGSILSASRRKELLAWTDGITPSQVRANEVPEQHVKDEQHHA